MRKACAKRRRIKVRKVSILLLPYSVTLLTSLHTQPWDVQFLTVLQKFSTSVFSALTFGLSGCLHVGGLASSSSRSSRLWLFDSVLCPQSSKEVYYFLIFIYLFGYYCSQI